MGVSDCLSGHTFTCEGLTFDCRFKLSVVVFYRIMKIRQLEHVLDHFWPICYCACA